MRAGKSERQVRLKEMLSDDPLLTDAMLASRLGVSVQTIRLDRLELGIPEMRARARILAERARQRVKSLGPTEVAGDLVHLELGQEGISIMETTREMSFKRTGIVRGHHLFAQGNSLAVALIDADVALTGSARLRFHEPVRVGDRVVAKAHVHQVKENKSLVKVASRVDGRLVFSAQIIVFSLDHGRVSPNEEGRNKSEGAL